MGLSNDIVSNVIAKLEKKGKITAVSAEQTFAIDNDLAERIE